MIRYNYNRSDVSAGIVHFGVGNFHRAHLEYYTNMLLEDPAQCGWGVFGAMIMPSDEPLFRALKADRGEYDLTTCRPDGTRTTYRIGSLVELEWGEEGSDAIIEKISSPSVKIITLTITEGGYKVDLDSEKSVFWYVCKALEKRMAAGLPITILSCDNLQHNGDTAKMAFMSYFKAKNAALACWAKKNVTFPNSMVDRITPATKSGKITDVRCEEFIQWVIEDKFIAGRPEWENVGVQFTSDVTPYENMKLSLLNASHTLLSYPSYLEGYRKVDAVMGDRRYFKLLKTFMDRDVTPYVPAPDGVDLGLYKETLLSRFSNEAISDQVSRLCGDGAAKFEVYVMPVLRKMVCDGRDTSIEAFLLASYCKYLTGAVTEAGEPIELFEPHLTESDRNLIERLRKDAEEGKPMWQTEFLELSPFAHASLKKHQPFVQSYLGFCSLTVAEGLDNLNL